MSYHVHITRKATSWHDKHDPATISLAEWEAYVASDAEMQVANDLGEEAALGYGATLAEAAAAVYHPSRSLWLACSKNSRAGRQAWFYHEKDRITVAGPDEEILAKMLAIAHVFGARVQGDDREYFDDPGQLSGLQPEAHEGTWVGSDFRDFQTFASAEYAQAATAAPGSRAEAARPGPRRLDKRRLPIGAAGWLFWHSDWLLALF